MASDRFLALNIGAGQITLGEFSVSSGRKPELLQYGIAPLGLEPDSKMDPSGFIIAALSDIMKNAGIRPGALMMTVSGQAVFPRFVKLPVVAKDKIRAMIQAEAEQNVPFPIEELTWDYQLIGSDETGEQNVMIVAAKTESIVSLTNAVSGVGLEPEVVDVAPLAIYNCVRYSYPNLTGCTMVLDIGSRSTNLIFIEEGKVFCRSIPVAGNTITQEIAKTFEVDFRAAEQMKKESGFVALGGNTASEDEDADRMSKCIRSVVTRLHAEVNRSINFYRSQQGGEAPQRIFLTGGSSILQHMDTFFREKLHVEVEFLNPYTGITFGPRVNKQAAGEQFYELAEVVGLAVRRSGLPAVEINLMPPNLVDKKTFRKRIPFFAASGAMLIASSVFFMLNGADRQGIAAEKAQVVQEKVQSFGSMEKRIQKQIADRDDVLKDLRQYQRLIAERTFVLEWMQAVQSSVARIKGLWLVEQATAADGKSLTLVCRGFDDLLKEEEKKHGGRTAPSLLGDYLSATKPFATFNENTDIKQTKVLDNGGSVREFTIVIGIKDTYQFQKGAEQ